MNLEQILSLLRTLLATGGPVAGILLAYGADNNKVQLWLGLAVAVVPPIVSALWGIFSKTDRALVVSASNVPGVTVKVDQSVGSPAPQSVKDTANDPNVPKVS